MLIAKIILGLIAAPFLGGGLLVLFVLVTSLVEWSDIRRWEPVTAYVIDGGVASESSRYGTIYRAYAEYTYTYSGNTYSGTRVAIGRDNLDDFQNKLGTTLAQAAGSATGIVIYVNPARPAESVVNRDMRWIAAGMDLIFIIIFGGFGLLIFIGIFRVPNREKDLTQPPYYSRPWLANDGWQTATINSMAKTTMYSAWVYTVLWNAASAPVSFLVYDEVLTENNYAALIGLLFPLVGFGLLIRAAKRASEWKKFGNSPVVLDPFPGSIGGHVGGSIDLNYPFEKSAQFFVTLACIRSYEHRSGNERRREETVLWQDTAAAYTERSINGTRIIFRFEVPKNLKPSDALKNGSDYHLWRLHLKGKLPGIDIDRDYEIPVYPTRQQSMRLPARAVLASGQATQQLERL